MSDESNTIDGMEPTNGRASIREVYQIAARLEGKLDAALEKQDNRIRKLENWRSWMAGVGAAGFCGLTIALRIIS